MWHSLFLRTTKMVLVRFVNNQHVSKKYKNPASPNQRYPNQNPLLFEFRVIKNPTLGLGSGSGFKISQKTGFWVQVWVGFCKKTSK